MLNMKMHLKFILIFICIVIAGICVYFAVFHKSGIKYKTIMPTRGDIKSSISASGSLSPTNEVEIGSVISGIVLEVLVEENDRVTKGQVLARINPESINQQLARYKAQLNSAKAQLRASQQILMDKKWNYDRLLELHQRTQGKSPSMLELQNAKTEYASALSDVDIKKAAVVETQTSIESANIDLKNSQISSSIDGVILTKNVEVGQSVAASFTAPTLFKVAESLEEMVLKAYISEADIGKIKEGQDVIFTVDAYPNKTFHAKVNKVNFGSVDSGSSSSGTTSSSGTIVSYIAHIDVDNKELLLRPNMSATADIIVAKAENTLLIPTSALYFDLDKALSKGNVQNKSKGFSFGSMFAPPQRPKAQISGNGKTQNRNTRNGVLWVLRDNIPEPMNVVIGISDGNHSEILGGIDESAQIIVGLELGK